MATEQDYTLLANYEYLGTQYLIRVRRNGRNGSEWISCVGRPDRPHSGKDACRQWQR